MSSSTTLSAALRSLALSASQDTTIHRSADVVEQHLPGHEELPFDQIAAFPGQDLKSFDFSQTIPGFTAPNHDHTVPSARVASQSSSPGYAPTTPLAEYREKNLNDPDALAVLSSSERLAKFHRGELDETVPITSRSVFFSKEVDVQRRNIKRLLGIYCNNRNRNDPRFNVVLDEIKGHDPFIDFENVSRTINDLGPFTIEKAQVLEVIEYIIIGNWQRMNITTAFLLSTLPCERNLQEARHADLWATGTNSSMLLSQGQPSFPHSNPPVIATPFPNSPPTFPQNTIAPLQSLRHLPSFVDESYRETEPITPRPQTQTLFASPSSTQFQPQSLPPLNLSRSAPSIRPTPSQQPRPIYHQAEEVALDAVRRAPNTSAEAVHETNIPSVTEVSRVSTMDKVETPRGEGPSTQLDLEQATPTPVTQPAVQHEQKPQESQQQSTTEPAPQIVKLEPPTSATSSAAPPSISTPSTSISVSSTSSLSDALPKKFGRLVGRDFKIKGLPVTFVWNVSHGPNKLENPGKTRTTPVTGDLFFHKVPVFTGDYFGSQVWLYAANKVWVDITEHYFSVTGEALAHPTHSQYFLSLRDDQTPSYVKMESWKKNQKQQRTMREESDNNANL